ncbi:unnamed protein product [Moneuplotes crassus]|uniref:Uncharacterized protein n=1 Tax=Euplotes crassus TaxID=5936 RepID=A0AAD1XBS8_EUPCR|nr:unnamed protein product [Moneuplotes crassus]
MLQHWCTNASCNTDGKVLSSLTYFYSASHIIELFTFSRDLDRAMISQNYKEERKMVQPRTPYIYNLTQDARQRLGQACRIDSNKIKFANRSHCQKYFDQIKKEYNTDNPMEYIMNNMCDTSPYYQFDLPQLTDPMQNPELQRMMVQGQRAPSKKRVGSKSQYIKQSKDMAESDSSGYFEYDDINNMKKRDLKALMKIMQDSSSPSLSNEKRLQRESNSDSSGKLFKIEKVSRSREESFSNSNSDSKNTAQQKNINTTENKEQGIAKDTSLQIKNGCNVILLNNCKVILQANKVESCVPSDVQKFGQNFNVVTPNYPCQIFIEPLILSKKELRDQTSKEGAYKGSIDESKKLLATSGSYSMNTQRNRAYSQASILQNKDFMTEMEIFNNIFCACVKQ